MATDIAGIELKSVNPMSESGVPLLSAQTFVGVLITGTLVGGTIAVANAVWGRSEDRVDDVMDRIPEF